MGNRTRDQLVIAFAQVTQPNSASPTLEVAVDYWYECWDGNGNPCDVSQAPNPSTFSLTINGQSRTSYFSVTVNGAYAAAVPAYDHDDNELVATIDGQSVSHWIHIDTPPIAPPTQQFETNWNGAFEGPAYICPMACLNATASYTTPAYFTLGTPRALTLFYNSAQARPRGTVILTTNVGSTFPAHAFELRLYRPNGTTPGTPVQFTNGEYVMHFAAAQGANALSVQFDASGLGTGVHNFNAVVKTHWASYPSQEQLVPVKVKVVDETQSVFGAGWSLAGVQRLRAPGDGTYNITDGYGTLTQFTYCVACGFHIADGLSTLHEISSGTGIMERRYPDGTRVRFHPDGRVDVVQNGLGHRTTFKYDWANRLYAVSDPVGKLLVIDYASNGKASSIFDYTGRTSHLVIDGSGDLARIADPEGFNSTALQLTYDSQHLLRTRADRAGNVWVYAYDYAGKLSADSAPEIKVYGQSALQRPVQRYRSVQRSLLVDPASMVGRSSTNRIPALLLDTVRALAIGPEGDTTKYTLSYSGQPSRTVDASGRSIAVTYVRYQPDEIWNEQTGAMDDFGYDSIGRIIYFKPHQKSETRIHYGPNSQPDTIRGPDRPTEIRYVRTNGLVDSVRFGQDIVTRYYYDSLYWRPDSVVDVGATGETGVFKRHKTGFKYEPSTGNVDSIARPGGRFVKFKYDSLGRGVSTRILGDSARWVTYDLLNRVTRNWVQGASPSDTAWAFHGRTVIDSIRDSRIVSGVRQTYHYRVDALGNPVAMIDPDMAYGVDSLFYDRAGQVVASRNRRAQVVQRQYDKVGRLVKRSGTNVTTDSVWHSSDDRVTIAMNMYTRDEIYRSVAGEVDSIVTTLMTGGAGRRFRVRYHNDGRGRRQQTLIADGSGSITFASRVFGYGTDGRMSSVSVNGNLVQFMYNEEGQRDTIIYPGNVVRAQYFTTNHEPSLTTITGANRTNSFWRQYSRDSVGRIARYERYLPGSSTKERTTFRYDGKGQLRGTEATTGMTQCGPRDPEYGNWCADTAISSIAYDAVSNRTQDGNSTGVYALANRVSSWASTSYGHDLDGNVTSMPARTLTWTATNQLDCVTQGAVQTCYRYNVAGYPVLRTVNGSPDRWCLGEGGHLRAERNATATQRIAEYVHIGMVDQPVALVTGATAIQAVRYFEQDAMGNVVGVHGGADVISQRISYGAWGSASTSGTLADTNRLRWKGLVWEPTVGLYFVRSRWYDPSLGRFLSEDPIGLVGGINRYAFGSGDPINRWDPFGKKDCPMPHADGTPVANHIDTTGYARVYTTDPITMKQTTLIDGYHTEVHDCNADHEARDRALTEALARGDYTPGLLKDGPSLVPGVPMKIKKPKWYKDLGDVPPSCSGMAGLKYVGAQTLQGVAWGVVGGAVTGVAAGLATGGVALPAVLVTTGSGAVLGGLWSGAKAIVDACGD